MRTLVRGSVWPGERDFDDVVLDVGVIDATGSISSASAARESSKDAVERSSRWRLVVPRQKKTLKGFESARA